MKHTQLYRRVMATNHKLVVVNTDDRSTKWLLRFDHCELVRAADIQNVVDAAASLPIEVRGHIKIPDERPVVIYDWEPVNVKNRDEIFDEIYRSLAATHRKYPVILLFRNAGWHDEGFLTVRNLNQAATILVSTKTEFLMDPPLKAILNDAVRFTTTYEVDAAYLGDVRETSEVVWDRLFSSIWNNMMINRRKAKARSRAMGRHCNRDFNAVEKYRKDLISALVDGEIKLRDALYWRP